jgi:hypothetical protein
MDIPLGNFLSVNLPDVQVCFNYYPHFTGRESVEQKGCVLLCNSGNLSPFHGAWVK